MAPAHSERRLRVALIARTPWDFPSLLALATPGIDFGTFDISGWGRPSYVNPFRLPIVSACDVVLVSSFWHTWLEQNHPDQVEAAFREFERRSHTVVAIDSEDAFGLLLPPTAFDRYQIVIKAHGIYRDRELYNYSSGAQYPGDQWHSKAKLKRETYSHAQLDKLRLGLPCFARDIPRIRRSIRHREAGALDSRSLRSYGALAFKDSAELCVTTVLRWWPIQHRPLDVHCLGSLTHVQRLAVLRNIHGLTGIQGITDVPEKFRGLVPDSELTREHREHIRAQAKPFLHSSTTRFRYQLNMSRHKMVVAPAGFGELTFRHGEALRAGATLIAPSLEHVETRFPFAERRNVIWCRTDVSDLRDRINELLRDEPLRAHVARNGRRDIAAWDRDWRNLFDAAIAAPLREATGSSR